jgi:magnesium chelatase family protein
MQARNPGGVGNGQLLGEGLLLQCRLSPEALELWQRAISQRRLSARAAERVLRVARTIADLDDQAAVGTQAIAEALTYRSFDQAL